MLSQQAATNSPPPPVALLRELLGEFIGTIRRGHEGGKQGVQGGDMATGPCEVLERNEEGSDSLKELPAQQQEGIQKPLKEDRKADAKVAADKEEVNGTPNGVEKEEPNKLHVIEQDLDEFVESMAEPPPPPEGDEHPAPQKVPRAEQVAEKVLRAERAPRVEKVAAEKLPRAERAPEKAPRAEKVAEKTPRAEKGRPAASPAPKAAPVKRKMTAGPAKDTLPWEGLTLNKCILVASLVALLSVSCQVVQDLIEFGEDVLEAELSTWSLQGGSPREGPGGELEELWFYERWFSWTDLDEPPDIDEEDVELLEIEEEEEEEEPTEEEEGPEPIEAEEEEEEEEEPVAKTEPRKPREKARREKPSKDKAPRGQKASEHEEDEDHFVKHHRQEGKRKEKRHPQEEAKSHRHHKEEVPPSKERKRERHPQDGGKGRHKDEQDKGKGRPSTRGWDSKPHPHEHKDRKPWQVQRPLFSPHKDSSHKLGKHKFQEGKRRG